MDLQRECYRILLSGIKNSHFLKGRPGGLSFSPDRTLYFFKSRLIISRSPAPEFSSFYENISEPEIPNDFQ